jgi:hypothetical protein
MSKKTTLLDIFNEAFDKVLQKKLKEINNENAKENIHREGNARAIE